MKHICFCLWCVITWAGDLQIKKLYILMIKKCGEFIIYWMRNCSIYYKFPTVISGTVIPLKTVGNWRPVFKMQVGADLFCTWLAAKITRKTYTCTLVNSRSWFQIYAHLYGIRYSFRDNLPFISIILPPNIHWKNVCDHYKIL